MSFQCRWIDDLDPFAVGYDDVLIPQPRQRFGSIDPVNGEDIGNIFLRQINMRRVTAGRVAGKQIQQITQFQKHIVVILMRGFVNQQIDELGIGFKGDFTQAAVLLEHPVHRIGGKLQCLHRGKGFGRKRPLDLEIRLVEAGENRAAAVEKQNFLIPVLVFRRGDTDAGLDVVYPTDQLAGFP